MGKNGWNDAAKGRGGQSAPPKTDFINLYFFIVKSSVGVGCLALPTVFHSAGWLLGSCMSVLICGAITYGIFALLRTKVPNAAQQLVVTYPARFARRHRWSVPRSAAM